MNEELARRVWHRARDKCEYCLLPKALSIMPFEIDHVIPRKHGGLTIEANLALACFYCNRYKGSNVAGIDPETRLLSRLFDPRRDDWQQHFQWREILIKGLTAIGRTTIEVLRLNHPETVLVRDALRDEGVFPYY